MPSEAAVEIRDATKCYDAGTVVLNHLDMTVPKGVIYGLLGASGSGKTTLLEAVVGLRQLDSGSVHVFGNSVEEQGTAGKRLGYMPQEIALYPYFTIREILLYFGRIYGMGKSEILEREEFLTNFLQLPANSKRISSLSGGQQRRVSLATAFVHNPELLILDEPTVGLDPLLRNSIWDHLCQMVKNGRTTVIITTHYTEEIRRSGMIGLMRYGRLLAEDSPDNLLQLFNAPLLEDIVLELCRRDHEGNQLKNELKSDNNKNESSPKSKSQPRLSIYTLTSMYGFIPRPIPRLSMGSRKGNLPFVSASSKELPNSNKRRKNSSASFVADSQSCDCVVVGFNDLKNALHSVNEEEDQSDNNTNTRQENLSPPVLKSVRRPSAVKKFLDLPMTSSTILKRIHSIIRRNCIFFVRNIWFFFILMVYPGLQTALVASTIGGDPKNMTLAVVNEEIPDWKTNCSMSELYTCDSGKYSCRFLQRLESDHLNLVSFPSREKAIEEIHTGSLYGVLSIPPNYTQHLVDRSLTRNFATNETLDGTYVNVKLDYSNYVASLLITRQLYRSLESYGMEVGSDCGKSSKEFEIPLRYRTPIYGRLESKYTEYVTPGALVIILFLVPLATCGLGFVSDKRQGTMDRSMAAGVSTFEIMVSFFVTDGLMIIIQTVISTLIMVYGFDFHIEGSYVLYGAICFLTGLCGQSWGFILGIICPDEAYLLLTGFSLHFPLLIQGGIIWPLEGIPLWVKYLSHGLPVTASLHSLRSIVSRGVGFTNIRVWPGFLILSVWIILAWCFAVVKYKALRK